MYKLQVNLYEWDAVCKMLMPRIHKRLQEELPMVEVKETYTDEDIRPVFRGLHDGALMFEIKWLCTSVDIVEHFKQRIK